jgi:hypothetical protein
MGYVRASVATFSGVLEALGLSSGDDRSESTRDLWELFEKCVQRGKDFDLVLRLSYYGPVDKLQQGPPRFMPATLSWISGPYAGTCDVDGAFCTGIWTSGQMGVFLKHALHDLGLVAEGRLKKLSPGEDPVKYDPL